MKLAVVMTLLLTTASAAAETAFEEYSDAIGRRPATQLFEAACDLDLQLRGAVATVEVRQRIVNPGPAPMAASYELDLPRGATVTGLSLRGQGGAALDHALAIRDRFHTVSAATRPVLGVDPALLEARPPGASSGYVVRLQPIAADHERELILRYTMVAEVRSGALRLELPGRAATGKLTACRGAIRVTPGPGASVARIRVDGTETGRRGTATFVVDARPVVLEAELGFTAREPLVWTQTQPLVPGWAATLVTVLAPPVRTQTLGPRRALFVVDVSRSMELVGRHQVIKVIRAVASALPTGTVIDAITYDRTATRVLGGWQPAAAPAITAIEKAVTARGALNGSDVTAAMTLAHTLIAEGPRDPTLVILISDGVIGEATGSDLTRALDAKTSTLDMLAVVLDPARTRSPGAAALQAPINLYGGAFVEANVDELDTALGTVDQWLRPSWLELELGAGIVAVPSSVHAGSGFTRTRIHRTTARRLVLTGHGEAPFEVAPRPAPAAPVATLALANAARELPFTTIPDPDAAELVRAEALHARAVAAHPYAHEQLAFAVLTTTGKIARSRIAMVRGGGPYERIVEVPDPFDAARRPVIAVAIGAPARASAIAKITLERLFREQLQPRAYACYQRALGTAPTLAGTVQFTLHLGRGEITAASLVGLAHPQLDACLLDAAYQLTISLPDFSINADDQTIARYPLTFQVSDRRPTIVPGDADSTSPLDIDAIEGGVPARTRPVKVNATTPLGGLRPTAP